MMRCARWSLATVLGLLSMTIATGRAGAQAGDAPRATPRAMAYVAAAAGVAAPASGVSVPASGHPAIADSARAPYSRNTRLVARSALGALGWVVGGLAGAYAGVGILGRDCGGCDDPGQESALKGFAVGGLAATALTVGSMALRDGCARPRRTGWALGGAALALAGSVALASADQSEAIGLAAALVTPPIAASLAATYSCRGGR